MDYGYEDGRDRPHITDPEVAKKVTGEEMARLGIDGGSLPLVNRVF
jgi:hypothetical protein